jgi:hypothetical protein
MLSLRRGPARSAVDATSRCRQEAQMIMYIGRFRSRLSDEQVQAMFEERAPRYLEVPGLVEKLYLRFRETGEWGAAYVFDSEESLERFRESDLAASIPSAYEMDGAAQAELADVALLVEPGATAAPVRRSAVDGRA